METAEIRRRYLEFFKSAPRNHVIIPSAPLVSSDSTTLFTGSGMQPLLPYLLGQPHPEGKRLADSQKSFRAEDIDEVGDNRHTTFFEMLGNWSLGDYWKEQQLPWFFEFLTDHERGAGLDPARLYVTVFAGDKETGIPADEDSIAIWKKLFADAGVGSGSPKYVELGSEANGGEVGMQGGRIFSYDVKKNWWSRAGVPSKMPTGEPGGPDSEVFYEFTSIEHDPKFGAHCHPNCDCGRFLEIGNSVFMEYKKSEDGSFEKLAQRNVDFGGGLERITAAANETSDIFRIDILKYAITEIERSVGLAYDEQHQRAMRIIADHMRSAVFLLADGVRPGNKERGYVLRRLIRKSVFEMHQRMNSKLDWISKITDAYIRAYGEAYPELERNKEIISQEIVSEAKQFLATIESGLKILKKYIADNGKAELTGEQAFVLFTTYGFPLELTLERAKVDIEDFNREFKKHSDLSRTASAGTFKGGLADHSEKTIKLHTAHHLLLKALQIVLGPQVKQRGSNITSERLRLDFNYDGKMTEEQKKEVERIVNEKIAEDLPVIRSEMASEDAEKLGAEHEFGAKYPERVSIYSIGPKDATQADPKFTQAFSIEFCGGPHVTHTGEIGHFTLAKEEAVAAGIRRVRGVVD